MNAIIPINVTALRVSQNDQDEITSKYLGRVACFEKIPYTSNDSGASTGDTVVRPLESGDSPLNQLEVGVHLHWELPDYFKKGVQTPDNPAVVFPQAPNRWLVTRYLTTWNDEMNDWGRPRTKSWVIESDFVAAALQNDDDGVSRPMVSVPLEVDSQPFGYMGRVQHLENWDPNNSTNRPDNYLPHYNFEDGTDAYLTSIGFLGPGFAAFYPDCCSVFGFWDHFKDEPHIYDAITENETFNFKVSYQVMGWIDGGTNDPLDGFADLVTNQYNDYVNQSIAKATSIDQTPADYYINLAQSNLGWQFNPDEIDYTLNGDQTLDQLAAPEKTICNGLMQEIVWRVTENPGTNFFLQNPDKDEDADGVLWGDTVDVAVGNTPLEALSALLKNEMETANEINDDYDDDLTNYEYLLDALQLNCLHDIETQPNKFIELEERLHSNGFSKHQSGLMWVVQEKPQDPSQPGSAGDQVTLPLTLAEQLNVLNKAQKDYDMARIQIDELRKQLYMDWFRFVNMQAGVEQVDGNTLDQVIEFLTDGYEETTIEPGQGELTIVQILGNETGILQFTVDQDSGSIIGMNALNNQQGSKADVLFQAFTDFQTAMQDYPQWDFFAVAADPFWLPTDPVTVMEGDRIEPIVRNGTNKYLIVRLSQQLIDSITVNFSGTDSTTTTTAVSAWISNPSNVYPILPAVTAWLSDPDNVSQIPPTVTAWLSDPDNVSKIPPAVSDWFSDPDNVAQIPLIVSAWFTELSDFIQTHPPVPQIPSTFPYADDLQSLLGESILLLPTFAGAIGKTLAAAGGNNNPGVANLLDFVNALLNAQGGLSPLDQEITSGLYATIHQDDYAPVANPVENVTTTVDYIFTFSNAGNDGWAPNPIAWNAQKQYPEFNENRYDPFLPVSLVWQASFDPLQQGPLTQGASQNGNGDYDATLLKDLFQLDADAIDYQYATGRAFTKNNAISYKGSVILSKKTSYSLTKQIDNYASQYPNDTDTIKALGAVADFYNERNYMAQTMSGFSINQVLRTYIAQIPVEDLTEGSRDSISPYINQLATDNPNDNWYDSAFNAQAPISHTPMAMDNFGPLRSGFMQIESLQIVDVFGQIMNAHTAQPNADGNLNVVSSIKVAPNGDDNTNADKLYLPPRLVVPSRLRFKWLSAEHNNEVSGVSDDFVEMNAHPATSPVFGWVLPNHLDNSLFFYQADGTAVGSFGIEHGDLVYRTAAGNLNNPTDDLSVDIGEQGSPTVNVHLANFLWYFNGKNAAFLQDMMTAIANSDQFIDPASHAQNASLSVLVGRPLALTRAILGLDTAGNILPLNQENSVWTNDVNNMNANYIDRMSTSSSSLGDVVFPIRLGDLINLDDGLVGYLIESTNAMPYDTFYAPTATANQPNGVEVPAFDTLQKQLNETPDTLTLLVDPRANVHATVGVLPVEELGIPVDQYSAGMQNLQMTFFTMPVLNKRQGLVVPLPQENGYQWSWVKPGNETVTPLKDQAADGNAIWDFTPQTAREGWLKLTPNTND